MSLASVSFREVQSIVETWTKKYQYHISLLDSKANQVRFMVQFSLPKPQKPVPIGTIRVYFTCRDKEGRSITFRFEKDSLIHSASKTIRHQEIEKWIDDALAKKLLVRSAVFYLGTVYQSTRVKDVRQDKILEEKVVEEEQQYVWIHPDLLSDQQQGIDIMQRPKTDHKALESQLVAHFKQIDKDGIGVLTHPEFMQVIASIGLKLSAEEEKQLLGKVDKSGVGMVEFGNYKIVVGEFFEALEAMKVADVNLETKREQEIFGAILMLINDKIYDVEELMMAKFKAKDDDETGFTSISEVKNVIEEINKKAKQEGQAQPPLNAIQTAQVTKILTDTYGYKEIPYSKIHKHIIDFKILQLSTGRVNASMNQLQVHLRQIFDKFDDKKFGRIKFEHLEQAIKKSQKIRVTKAQMYLLKNMVPSDGKGELNYIENSKLIAEIVKKFYIHSSRRRQ